jgi:hypothetical protein
VPEISIEPGGVKAEPCARCGRCAFIAHGYAYANGDAFGIYFVDWCEGHDDHRRAYLTLAVGDWDEDRRRRAGARFAWRSILPAWGSSIIQRETAPISSGNFCRGRQRFHTWSP